MFLLTLLCPDLPLPFCDHSGGVHWLFQGLNFSGADLSRLDLRYINFKMANLSRCNLAHANLCCANLERADLSGSVLDVRMLALGSLTCPAVVPKNGNWNKRINFLMFSVVIPLPMLPRFLTVTGVVLWGFRCSAELKSTFCWFLVLLFTPL